MGTFFPATIPRPITTHFRHLPTTTTTSTTTVFLSPPKNIISKTKSLVPPFKITDDQKTFKWVVRLRSVVLYESPPKPTTFDAKPLVDFLYEDVPHAFDDQGIDRTAYDECIKYTDPISKYEGISWYLFYIAMLRKLFSPDYQLHWVRQTGPYEITLRWTMVMRGVLLPWKPEFVFTGTSVMGINPETQKFCSHMDYWDSIESNAYFSVEALVDLIKQMRIYKTPDLETPKYQTLKRTAHYEVRKYDPFIVVETIGDKLSGSSGFNSFSGLPAPNDAEISLRKVEGGIAAVSIFSGKPTEDVVREKEKALRSNLMTDGLRSKDGCLLARYNDPIRTWSFMMRNEVFIWLEEFSMD